MNKNSRIINKKIIYSLILNTAVLLIALFVFTPGFEENDDTHMAMIAEGAFGIRNSHIFFSNILLGKFTVLLQTLVPAVRWHIILQYVFIYMAYVFSTYVLVNHRRGKYVSVIAVLSTFYELYDSVQFTKTATFVCAAGYLLLFEYIRNKTQLRNKHERLISKEEYHRTENTVFLTVGLILITYGIMLRFDGLFLAAVPALAVGIIELLRTKNLKKYIIVFAPVLALFFILRMIDSVGYSSSAGWENVMERNTARSVLMDSRCDILDYSKYGEELKELGVSENDALMLLTYQFGDNDVFSFERMKEIAVPFPKKAFGYETFANLFENIVNEFKRTYTLLAGLIGLIAVLIASIVVDRSKSSPGFIKDSRYKLYMMFVMGASCAAALVYFQYAGRYSRRLVSSLVISAIFMICYMLDGVNLRENRSEIVFGGNKDDITHISVVVLAVVIVIFNGMLYISNHEDFKAWKTEHAPIVRELDLMSEDKDAVYVFDTFTLQNLHKYDLFRVFPQGYYSNIFPSGSWYLGTPVTDGELNKYGYSNPFEALRDTEAEVYLIDNGRVDNKITFLNEHYDGSFSAELQGNRGGLNIYKIIKNQ